MKNGEDLLSEADNLIYGSERTKIEKADLLTSMAILSGIVSDNLPAKLINRRKDIMIESAAYDIIKKDGIQEGMQKGIQEGMQKGMILEAREMLMEAIQARFEIVPDDVSAMVTRISDRNILKAMLKHAIMCQNVDALREKLSIMAK